MRTDSMRTDAIHRLEAWALMVGPAMALVFFLVEPGGLLVEPADSMDSVGRITALAANPFLAHLSALFVPLGLLLLLYGLSGVSRVTTGPDYAAAGTRFGLLSATVGGVGWILATGLDHLLAQTKVSSAEALAAAIPTYRTGLGITLVSGVAVSLGLLAFSLSLAARERSGLHRTAALVIAVVSAISVAALIIGYTTPSEAMIAIGRACYFPWVIWFIMLGSRFLKAGRPA
ncbi:MAG: hypothetical protein F4Y40_03785 [Acidimicrobiia bacterium]|nr:hypothetical protein [Acidimicrobiia bacterium]